MTVKEILLKEYKEHKSGILIYITLCILTAFIAGPFLTVNNIGTAHATEVVETLTEVDTVTSVIDLIFKKNIRRFAGTYSNIIGISVDPIAGMFFIATMSYLNTTFGNGTFEMGVVPIGTLPFVIVLGVFFVGTKLMKVFETTKVVGELTLGTISDYMGKICIVVMSIMLIAGVADASGAAAVSAAGFDDTFAAFSRIAASAVTIFVSIMMAIATIIVNIIIKTVFKAVDLLQLALSHFPPITAAIEIIRTLALFGFIILGIALNQWKYGYIFALALDMVIFLFCCIVFRKCYMLINYYEHVYVKPMLHAIKGYRGDYPLVRKRLPRGVKKAFSDSLSDLKLVIPVYVKKSSRNNPLHFKKRRRLWFVNDGKNNYLILKKYMEEKNYKHLINSDEERTVYLRRGKRFFEIFIYENNEKNLAKKNPRKEWSLVFAKDYYYRTDEIFAITGYVNFVDVKEEAKLSRKEERKEARLETKNKIKAFFSRNKESEEIPDIL